MVVKKNPKNGIILKSVSNMVGHEVVFNVDSIKPYFTICNGRQLPKLLKK
jgi:hypothetical protein